MNSTRRTLSPLAHALLILLSLHSGITFAAVVDPAERIFKYTDHPGYIYSKLVYLPSGGTYRFLTHNLSSGQDTIMHLYSMWPTKFHIASNDDISTACGLPLPPLPDALGSCIKYVTPTATFVQIFVHRYSNSNPWDSLLDITVSKVGGATLLDSAIYAGGDITRGVETNTSDQFQFAFVGKNLWSPSSPPDPTAHGLLRPIMLLLSSTNTALDYSYSTNAFGNGGSNGIWGQPSITAQSTASNRVLVLGAYYWNLFDPDIGDGSGIVYRNDALLPNSDNDMDRIGDQLELALGTLPDNPDTDSDGLRDDWEVIGGCPHYNCQIGGSSAINLAYFGASPIRKDLFIQVDWMKVGTTGQLPISISDLSTVLSEIREVSWRTSSSIGIPKNRINIFFDYGQLNGRGGTPYASHAIDYATTTCLETSVNPACQVTYGDCPFNFTVCQEMTCPSGTRCSVDRKCVIPGCESLCQRFASYHTINYQDIVDGGAGTTNLLPANRRQLFSELFLDTSANYWISDYRCDSGTPMGRTIWSFCAPNLPFSPTCRFVNAGMVSIRAFNGISAQGLRGKLFHELGHLLGLADFVRDDNNVLRVRPPNHVSAMNYAFVDGVDQSGNLDFSSGARPTLTQSSLLETAGIGDFFAANGNDYQSNKMWTLGGFGCMSNNLGLNGGVGPGWISGSPLYPANIDWNKNGAINVSPVSGLLWEPTIHPACASGDLSVGIPDPNEWLIAAQSLSSGIRGMLSASFGTLYCAPTQGIECPPGYNCGRAGCGVGSRILFNPPEDIDDFILP